MKAVMAVFMVFISIPALAQSGVASPTKQPVVAILAKGSVNFGEFHAPFANVLMNGSGFQTKLVPGVEVVLFPLGRMSFGVEMLSPETLAPHIGGFTDAGLHDGVPYSVQYESTITSSLGMGVMGSVYLNAGRGKVRPFVGGGFGTQEEESEERIVPSIYPLVAQEDGNKNVVKAVGGVAVYPVRHFTVRLEGGWRNGGYAAVSAGFTF
jgi:hypothetical protein